MLFSVIVPAHNVELWIEDCLESICSATVTDLEILVVDDGSTDSTGDIVRKLALRDERIKLIVQQNGGIGSARNAALAQAKGDWIAFVDSDDRVSADFFEMTAEEQLCDVVQKTAFETTDSGQVLRKLTKPWPKHIIADRKELLTFFVSAALPAVWNKFVKRKVLGDLRFIGGVGVIEDLPFTAELMNRVGRYAISSVGSYYYRVQSQSVIQQSNRKAETRIGRTLGILPNLDRKTIGTLQYRQSLIVRYILFVLYHQRHYFSREDCVKVRALVREIRFRNLAYLLPKYRLRWLLVRSVLLLPGR